MDDGFIVVLPVRCNRCVLFSYYIDCFVAKPQSLKTVLFYCANVAGSPCAISNALADQYVVRQNSSHSRFSPQVPSRFSAN